MARPADMPLSGPYGLIQYGTCSLHSLPSFQHTMDAQELVNQIHLKIVPLSFISGLLPGRPSTPLHLFHPEGADSHLLKPAYVRTSRLAISAC